MEVLQTQKKHTDKGNFDLARARTRGSRGIEEHLGGTVFEYWRDDYDPLALLEEVLIAHKIAFTPLGKYTIEDGDLTGYTREAIYLQHLYPDNTRSPEYENLVTFDPNSSVLEPLSFNRNIYEARVLV
ncbi:MAG TPA: hypothetical protein ENI23_03805, partial [bacterium]|nr:hypothetical protein [bacterium]